MTDPSTPSSPLRSALREPLLYFVLLAVALFGVSRAFGGANVIDITNDEIDWRVMQLEAQEGRSLTDEERQLVRERYIDERVLVREAKSERLDADDRIDDILVQKMLHVLSGEVIQPTDEELQAFYDMNTDRYATDATVTVDEVVAPMGAALPKRLLDGGEPAEVGNGALIASRVMPRLTLADLAQIFGDEAASEVFHAETGEWVAAYQSVRGQHWFRVRERADAQVPPLAVVRETVRLDWISEQEDRRLLAQVAELRKRYTIRIGGETVQ